MKKLKIAKEDGRYLIYYYKIPLKKTNAGRLEERIQTDKDPVRLHQHKSVCIQR